MKKTSKKQEKHNSFLLSLVAVVLIAGVIVITAIGIKSISNTINKKDGQRFADSKEQITVVQTEVLFKLKEVCKQSLEKAGVSVKDHFISVDTIDNQYYIFYNVLTDEDKYVVYNVDSSMLAPLALYIMYGDTYTTPYATEIEIYMDNVVVSKVDTDEKIINIG